MSVEVDLNRSFALDRRHGIVQSQDWNNWRTVSTRNPEVVLAETGTVTQMSSVDTSGISISGSTGAGWVLFPEVATSTGLVNTANLSILASSRSTIQKLALQERDTALTRNGISSNISITVISKSSIASKVVQEIGTTQSRSEIAASIVITGYSKVVVVRGIAREYVNAGCTVSGITTDQIKITAKVT